MKKEGEPKSVSMFLMEGVEIKYQSQDVVSR